MIVSFMLGPVLVIWLVLWGGCLLTEEVIKVEGLCRERLEREKGS